MGAWIEEQAIMLAGNTWEREKNCPFHTFTLIGVTLSTQPKYFYWVKVDTQIVTQHTTNIIAYISLGSRGPNYAESGHNVNLHLLMACLASLSIIGLCWTPPVHARTPCARSIYQMRLLIGCSQFGSCSRLLIGCSEIGSCSICQSGQLIWTESDRCYLNSSMQQSLIF